MAKAEKKSKSKSRRPRPSKGVTAVPKKPEELQDARNRVRNAIVDASIDMTKQVVRSVNERGSVLALRFLWEIAGMFPASAAGGAEEREPVAKTLIEKLGFYEEFPASYGGEGDRKGDVESE